MSHVILTLHKISHKRVSRFSFNAKSKAIYKYQENLFLNVYAIYNLHSFFYLYLSHTIC